VWWAFSGRRGEGSSKEGKKKEGPPPEKTPTTPRKEEDSRGNKKKAKPPSNTPRREFMGRGRSGGEKSTAADLSAHSCTRLCEEKGRGQTGEKKKKKKGVSLEVTEYRMQIRHAKGKEVWEKKKIRGGKTLKLVNLNPTPLINKIPPYQSLPHRVLITGERGGTRGEGETTKKERRKKRKKGSASPCH